MMDVPAAFQSALEDGNFTFAWLLELPDGIYMTDNGDDIALAGKTYVSNGHILNLPSITRESTIKLDSYTPTLSNVDGALYTALTARNMTGETCKVLLVLLDDAGAVIGGQAVGMYAGTLNAWSNRESANSDIIDISITSNWAKPTKTAGRITSPNNQEDNFPGDKFMEFAHEQKSNLGWGAEA